MYNWVKDESRNLQKRRTHAYRPALLIDLSPPISPTREQRVREQDYPAKQRQYQWYRHTRPQHLWREAQAAIQQGRGMHALLTPSHTLTQPKGWLLPPLVRYVFNHPTPTLSYQAHSITTAVTAIAFSIARPTRPVKCLADSASFTTAPKSRLLAPLPCLRVCVWFPLFMTVAELQTDLHNKVPF